MPHCNIYLAFKIRHILLKVDIYLKKNKEGQWGQWSDWSSCSPPLGLGSQARTRHCNNPALFINGTSCAKPEMEKQLCGTGN
jgi:hypothetical protein